MVLSCLPEASTSPRGALLSGDTVQVTPHTQKVSFLYSYPNQMPLGAAAIKRIATALEPWPFERIYGAFPGRGER